MCVSAVRATALAGALALSFHVAATTFFVTNGKDGGPGSLRQAVLDANASPGRDTIVLQADIDPPTEPMPPITGPVDVSSAPTTSGWHLLKSPRLYIHELTRFRFAAGSEGSTLRSVAFGGYYPAATLDTTDVTVTGIVAPGVPLIVTGDRNTIGGPAEADANEAGTLWLNEGSGNTVLRNSLERLHLRHSYGNTIGRTGAGNTIEDVLHSSAEYEFHKSPGNVFEGNTIDDYSGFDPSPAAGPTTIVGNTFRYLALEGDSNSIIRDNFFHEGVAIDFDTVGVTILGNSFAMGPGRRPIAFHPEFQSYPNDPAPDADTGPNSRQNHPVLSIAYQADSIFVVEGIVTSAPSTPYEVELFAKGVPVSSFLVETDETGNAPFVHSIPGLTPPRYAAITATATNRASHDVPGNVRNSTSEMSRSITASNPGVLSPAQIVYRVEENAGSVTIVVQRIGATHRTATVTYTTTDGSANAPGDYTSMTGTLTFAPEVTVQSFTIPIAGDDFPEPAETFTVTLSGATGGMRIRKPEVTVAIDDLALASAQVPALSWWSMLTLTAALAAIALYRRA